MKRGWLFRGFIYVNIALLVVLLMEPSFWILRQIFFFNSVVLPAALMVVAAMFFFRWFSHKRGRDLLVISVISLVLSVGIMTARVYVSFVEPSWLAVREVTVESEKVAEEIKILHITDIQSEFVDKYEQKAFEMMNDIDPDLVLHTGDLLQPGKGRTFESELPKMSDLIESLNPRLGIYGVLGDVDGHLHFVDDADMGGMRLLDNESIVIHDRGTNINILGLSLMNSTGSDHGEGIISDWISKAGENEVTMVIGHRPDYVLDLLDQPIDLCLAGHTHGGQVRIPFLGPIITMSKVPRSWARGFREVGKTRLNVSAGIGCEHMDDMPSLRFMCRPEMTLIRLVPKDKI